MHALWRQLVPKSKKAENTLSVPKFSFEINQTRFCHSWRGISEGEEKPEESYLNLEGRIRNREEPFSAASASLVLFLLPRGTATCNRPGTEIKNDDKVRRDL